MDQTKTAPSRQLGSPSPSPSQDHQRPPSSPQARPALNQAPSADAVPSTSNPFSRQSLIAKRQAIIAQLREERQDEGTGSQAAQPTQNEHARQAPQASEAEAKPAQASTASPTAPTEQKRDQSPPSQELVDLQRRNLEVEAAQKKVAEARSEADKQIALSEQKKKEAQAALQELEWAKNEPLEFLAKIGMKDEEWKAFLAGGGKQSPETKRMKAMEQRYQEMEARQKALEERSERAAYDARIQNENASFQNEMSSYVLIPRLGGLPQVRMKQQQLSQAQGSFISLKDAADALEKELESGLQPLLKHDDVRRKLGLADRHHSSVNEPPKVKTQNGQADVKPAEPEAKDEDPKPWDWAAKKRRALQLLAQSSIGGS